MPKGPRGEKRPADALGLAVLAGSPLAMWNTPRTHLRQITTAEAARKAARLGLRL